MSSDSFLSPNNQIYVFWTRLKSSPINVLDRESYETYVHITWRIF